MGPKIFQHRQPAKLRPDQLIRLAILTGAVALCIGPNRPSIRAADAMQTPGRAPQLWLYDSTNLLVNANDTRICRIWTLAARPGYSHILLSDSKLAHLNVLGGNTAAYMRNVERVRKLAKQLHLTLVPAVFPIGYSNDILYANPTLAEGVPVRNVSFIVENNVGRPAPQTGISLGNKPSWQDSTVGLQNGMAQVSNPVGNARMVFARRLHRFCAYHIHFMIRTQGFTGRPKLVVLTRRGGRNLQYESLKTKATQSWKRYDLVFDTLNHRRVGIYFGVWGSAHGRLDWKNWRLTVAGLVNPLSRPGAPTTITGYRSGVDYRPIVDPELGNRPWPGAYVAWHKPVNIHFLRPVPNGTVVRVSWYYPPIFYDGQVAACLGSGQFRDLLAQNARSVRAAFHTGHYMMDIDEDRVLDWDKSCTRLHETPGQILAATTRYCRNLLHGDVIYTWSDMFDPNHNAHGSYYLVNGSWAGSWNGLGRRTIVMNWNGDHKRKSLKFFEARGNRQIIAAYYDAPLSQTAAWIRAAKPVPGVIGYMYTTWTGDYRKINAFATLIHQAYGRQK